MAPTWKNYQPARFYAVCSDENLERIREGGLPSFNQKNSGNAALIVCTFLKDRSGFTKGVPDNEQGNLWGAFDLGCQDAYLVLKAADMGLDTLIMGIRNADFLREELAIPENEEIMTVIAVGYCDGEKVLHPRKEISEVLKFF